VFLIIIIEISTIVALYRPREEKESGNAAARIRAAGDAVNSTDEGNLDSRRGNPAPDHGHVIHRGSPYPLFDPYLAPAVGLTV
jgi:hypothetical protein